MEYEHKIQLNRIEQKLDYIIATIDQEEEQDEGFRGAEKED